MCSQVWELLASVAEAQHTPAGSLFQHPASSVSTQGTALSLSVRDNDSSGLWTWCSEVLNFPWMVRDFLDGVRSSICSQKIRWSPETFMRSAFLTWAHSLYPVKCVGVQSSHFVTASLSQRVSQVVFSHLPAVLKPSESPSDVLDPATWSSFLPAVSFHALFPELAHPCGWSSEGSHSMDSDQQRLNPQEAGPESGFCLLWPT